MSVPISHGIQRIADVLTCALNQRGLPLVVNDNGSRSPCHTTLAAAPDGFLPAFLVTAEALWFELTGHGFGLTIVTDPEAALGVTVTNHDAQSSVVVLLCLLEVLDLLPVKEGQIDLCDLTSLWHASLSRIQPARIETEEAA
ncbi:hypothetical protein [Gluconobacter oxydans]|uniref:hypothetical protein n=1 Tax=Gluconobacter oxydans TaxID=442 RepID=UPI000781F93B|nr:hypothetical protein [Gluconobacter oxydans]